MPLKEINGMEPFYITYVASMCNTSSSLFPPGVTPIALCYLKKKHRPFQCRSTFCVTLVTNVYVRNFTLQSQAHQMP